MRSPNSLGSGWPFQRFAIVFCAGLSIGRGALGSVRWFGVCDISCVVPSLQL